MTADSRPRVSRTAYLLGYAGLLPQVAAVGGLLVLRSGAREWLWPLSSFAILYSAIILSFLGGLWWAMAMGRNHGQGRLAALAILPSLSAIALLVMSEANYERRLGLVAIGSAIMMTLLVDRHLVSTGEAPAGWMRLRVPLSLGLGGLTILAGLLAA